MKNFLFALLTICSFALVSCGGDDGCEQDLSGTYTGTLSCTLAGDSDATLVISGTDGSYTLSGAGLPSGSFDQDGCTLKYDETPLGTGEVVTVTFPDSTSVSVVREITVLGATTETCSFTGTK